MDDITNNGGEEPAATEHLLRELLTLVGADPGRPPTLQQLKKEVSAYGLRRADALGGRDNLIYRVGYALDAIGALDIPADQFAGILSSADLVREIVNSFGDEPLEESMITLIGIALTRPEIAEWASDEGRRYQWNRLHALDAEDTAAFKASPAGQMPQAGWRNRKPTKSQIYRIAEIVRLTGQDDPCCSTRGEAYEFIDKAGGNPRFWNAPSRAARPRYR